MPTTKLSLNARSSPLAAAGEQRRILDETKSVPPFEAKMRQAGLAPFHADGVTVFQVNLGKLCNQTCRHCHVDAGPDRRETMAAGTVEACLNALARTAIPTLDITGGAPELHPSFRRLVKQGRALGRHVIDRCNLSVLLLPSQEGLADFLAAQRVEIIASLPYYLPGQTDAQRGEGVFEKSIRALQRLNQLGYGRPESGLALNLVYNPAGAFLPPRQGEIETRFRKELQRRHDIVFNRLYTLTNMPISRFLEFLIESGNYEGYMERLANAFNPAAASGMMCRHTLSVGWEGTLYDCDFNQMLDLPVGGAARRIGDVDLAGLDRRRIVTGNHCYGCAAGAGSSCGGAIE